MLVLYIEQFYNVNSHVTAWQQLLTAIGKKVFGPTCIQRLNELALAEKDLKAFTLAIFSSIVLPKLAFVCGENFIIGAYKSAVLGPRYRGHKMKAKTNI